MSGATACAGTDPRHARRGFGGTRCKSRRRTDPQGKATKPVLGVGRVRPLIGCWAAPARMARMTRAWGKATVHGNGRDCRKQARQRVISISTSCQTLSDIMISVMKDSSLSKGRISQ